MNMQDKMIVSAALDRLISGDTEDWQVDAQDVIERCVLLPESKEISYSLTFDQTRDRDSTGYAAGFGNVSVQEEGKHELQEEYNDYHRIGNYRIARPVMHQELVIVQYREFGMQQNLIDMADAPVGTLIPAGYVLRYDQEGYPVHFYRVLHIKYGGVRQLYSQLKLWLRDFPRSLRYSPSSITVCLLRPSGSIQTLYPEKEQTGT